MTRTVKINHFWTNHNYSRCLMMANSAIFAFICSSVLAPLPVANAQLLPAPNRRLTTFVYDPAPERGMPLVRVRVNNGVRNEATATFVLDTGFTDCIISDRLAHLLKMDGAPALREDGTPARFADGKPLQQVMPSVQMG